MVTRIIRYLSRDIRGLHEAAYVLALFALLSQVLGLVRDRLFAHIFGASSVLDVYYAAFRVPDLIFVTVASIVSVSVLIPFIADYSEKHSKKLQSFLRSTATAFGLIIIAVSGVVYLYVPELSRLFFPGITGADHTLLIDMTHILLLSPILLGISNLFGSITQTYKKFLLYATGPVLYNLGIVIGILGFYPYFGINGLAWGVVLGAALHAGIQIPFLFSKGLFPWPTFSVMWDEVWKVLTLSLPRTIALSAHQIVFVVLLAAASLIGEGAITVFNFSWNLQSVPLSIIGVSYSVAAFPTLARLFSSGKHKDFLAQIVVAARHIIFWSLPALVLFVVLRAQVVRVLLGSGEFGWTETRLTAAVLAMFVVSLVAQALVLLFVRGYYAAGNTRRPLIINVVSALLIIVFSGLLLMYYQSNEFFKDFIESLFRIEGLEGTSVVMLSFAYTLGLLINALAFWILFQRDFSRFSRILGKTFFQSLSASVVMGFVAHRFLAVFDNFFDINTLVGIFLQGFLSGILGIIAGIAILFILRNEEVYTVLQTFKHKFWKTTAISPDQREL